MGIVWPEQAGKVEAAARLVNSGCPREAATQRGCLAQSGLEPGAGRREPCALAPAVPDRLLSAICWGHIKSPCDGSWQTTVTHIQCHDHT